MPNRPGDRIAFNKVALAKFKTFATSPDAAWSGNFRDLGAAVTRMATLAPSGRITEEIVAEEQLRLTSRWKGDEKPASGVSLEQFLNADQCAEVDPFDRPQLEYVIAVCRQSRSLSEAGRTLFAASRKKRKTANDADRLRKYLARFGLDWGTCTQ